MFPLTSIVEVTEAPIEIPVKAVKVLVEEESTRMLLDAAPVPVLPIILLLTDDGGVALFTYMPKNVEGPGAAPIFLISIPPTWLPVMRPPVLRQLIPLIIDGNVAEVVVVVTVMDPLSVFDPIIFPSPVTIPPMFMPEPLVSIPIKTFAAVDEVGTAETDMEAIVLVSISETGIALVVVNNIPW